MIFAIPICFFLVSAAVSWTALRWRMAWIAAGLFGMACIASGVFLVLARTTSESWVAIGHVIGATLVAAPTALGVLAGWGLAFWQSRS